jgi:hypothetical protein
VAPLALGHGLLLLLLPCTAGLFKPPARGDFASSGTGSSFLVEGDIAVPDHLRGSSVQNAFLADATKLWPRGVVHYRFETTEWDEGPEPVFLDSQMQNITMVLEHIEQEVPCIEFR